MSKHEWAGTQDVSCLNSEARQHNEENDSTLPILHTNISTSSHHSFLNCSLSPPYIHFRFHYPPPKPTNWRANQPISQMSTASQPRSEIMHRKKMEGGRAECEEGWMERGMDGEREGGEKWLLQVMKINEINENYSYLSAC